MKKALKSFFSSLRFKLSASDSFLFTGYYKRFYNPKPGTLESTLSAYSKKVGTGFTVVQVGANDGINHDPIHKFIKRDRWNGVLLEPQKYVFDKFLSKLYKNHSNLSVLNAAMGANDGEATIYKIGFSEARWATGLTTFDRPTLEKAFTSGHVQRKCEKDNTPIPVDKSQHIVEEKVRIISSASLLKEYNISNVDLLMIDTEGFDYEIIKFFQIEKNAPQMIIFEHSHLSEDDYLECINHLKGNGYTVKKDGPNTAAIKNELDAYPDYFNQ
ncbi:MAG: FkbM family methyltransferase [Crocinitomicaceae bacterium]